MIEKLLNKFYFLTKLSTSLILFIIIIFFGYLFSRAYILKSGNEQSFLINEQINELFVSVKHNSESLKNINNKIISSEESLTKIQLKIDQQSNTDVLLDQINLLLKANEEINKELRQVEENPNNTFTPMPRNITPLGMELDPDAGVDLSNKENKN